MTMQAWNYEQLLDNNIAAKTLYQVAETIQANAPSMLFLRIASFHWNNENKMGAIPKGLDLFSSIDWTSAGHHLGIL